MIVTVVKENVQAGTEEEFALCGCISEKRGGEAENEGVFVAGCAEVRFEKSRCGMKMKPLSTRCAVKASCREEATCLGFDKSVRRHIGASFGR